MNNATTVYTATAPMEIRFWSPGVLWARVDTANAYGDVKIRVQSVLVAVLDGRVVALGTDRRAMKEALRGPHGAMPEGLIIARGYQGAMVGDRVHTEAAG